MLAHIIDVKTTPNLPQRLIIPMVSPPHLLGHFFVACFDFSVHHPNFLLTSHSTTLSNARRKRIHQASTAAAMVKKVNLFFNKHILHKNQYLSLQQSDTDLLQRVQYKDCPIQKNGHNCGIFAVAAQFCILQNRFL